MTSNLMTALCVPAHPVGITAVATGRFLDHDEWLATGSWDCSVKLWRAKGTVFIGSGIHSRPVLALAASTSNELVSVDAGGCVRWWAATRSGLKTTGERVMRLVGDDYVVGLAVGIDGEVILGTAHGRLMAACRLAELWSISTGSLCQSIAAELGRRSVLVGGVDGVIRRFTPSSEEPVSEYRVHRGAVRALALTADGNTVISGGSDYAVCVTDLRDGGLKNRLEGHTSWVNAVALSQCEEWIVSGGCDRTIRIWDPRSATAARVLRGHAGPVCAVGFSRRIISGSCDGTLRAWNAPQVLAGIKGNPKPGHSDSVWSMAFSASGQWLASASADRTLRVWRLHSGARDAGHRVVARYPSWVNAVAMTASGEVLVAGAADCSVRVFRPGISPLVLNGHRRWVNGVAITSTASQVVSGSADGTVRAWCTRSGAAMWELGCDAPVWGVALSTRAARAVAAAADGRICSIALDTGARLFTVEAHEGGATSVAITTDGRIIVSAGADGIVNIWDGISGARSATMKAHSDRIWTVGLSADGRRAVSASADGVLCLFDPFNGRVLDRRQFASPATAAAISANGKVVSASDRAGSLYVFNVDDEALRDGTIIMADGEV